MLAEVQLRDRGRSAVVRLTGDVDLSNAEGLGRAIGRAIPNHALMLILDLRKVDFLDSAGIQLIYRLREELRTRAQTLRLVMASTSPTYDALRLAGVARHVDIVETIEDSPDVRPAVQGERGSA